MRFASSAALVAASLAVSATAAITNPVPPIEIIGSKFFYTNNGSQFFIRGIAYQQDAGANGTTSSDDTALGYIDPLADESTCKRDIPYLIQLRTNVIRTYAIDPTVDHDACMQLLNDAGIYVISDLSSPDESINRNSPAWDLNLYSRYTAVVDALAPYNNTLGFFAGNEVSNSANTTAASAFVKAAVRDTKAYIVAQGYRSIGVGYATSDDAEIRVQLADYFNCGTDQKEAIDFWGYNIYSWCGDSSLSASGYLARTEEFANYSVPAFFAEYGCNTVQPRTFTETAALYGDVMSPVWSGGIVYMYFQESNDYGLVSIDGSTVSTLADFSYLSAEIATVSPSSTASSAYTPTNSAQACPTTDATWEAVATPLPPTPDAALCDCMVDSLTCVAKSSVDSDDYATLFSEVCGYSGSPCAGINTNYSEGAYGAYGMCNTSQQLSYVFNAYYDIESESAGACSFGGSATTVSPSATAASCSALLSEVGASGTGVVTAAASGSGAASSSSGRGAPLSVHHVQVGNMLSLSVCGLVAFVTGAFMILL